MIQHKKVVRDPIHGNITLSKYSNDLLESPELQRLYDVKQLGFAHLVFPGAHHTRFEHSLGTYHIASQIADVLELNEEHKKCVSCAALLHDIGHGPFSHTLESILKEKFGVDHVDLTEELILGNYEIFSPDEKQIIRQKTVAQILDDNQINKNNIVKIIRGQSSVIPILGSIMNSTVDADQLDYLMRDAYYTGVSYGLIDIQRLLQTLTIHNENIAVERKGVSAVENILMARGLMYSSVYFHKTVRIAELMLSKAIEMIPDIQPFEFFKMTDAELINAMRDMGSFQQHIQTRLKYRILFKQAYAASFRELDTEAINALQVLENSETRRQKEQEMEDALHIPHGNLIIDIPQPELLLAEPRLHKTDIFVVDHNESNTLDEYTPVAKAIRSRIAPDWIVMIVTDERYRDIVSQKAESFLFR